MDRRRVAATPPFRLTRALLAALVLFAAFALRLAAANLPPGFVETQIALGFTSPTAMEFAPDGRIFVCQQAGRLRVIKNQTLLAADFLTLSVNSSGERGLLGIAFDPAFATNQFVYVYYTVPASPAHNRVSRFTANGDVAVPGSELVILELDNLSGATNHNGGAIHFGPDGKLYVAVGENANGSNAQTLGNRLGKMLRINSDGTIPADNPTTFPNIAGSPTGNNRAIWAVGLRNPFTFGFDPASGRMFINDVGEGTWEEINDGIAGSNYGWSIYEGPVAPAPYRNPVHAYKHSSGTPTGCAIVGGAFYVPASGHYPVEFAGDYFFADLCGGWVWRYDNGAGTADEFITGIATPVDLKIGPLDGDLYYLARSSGANGAVYRVSRTTAPAPFTDEPLQAGLTTIKAQHIVELRSRVDAVRVAKGLPFFMWTDPSLTAGANTIGAVHITELRAALTGAYNKANVTPPVWTDPLDVGTAITTAHIEELRSAVVALE